MSTGGTTEEDLRPVNYDRAAYRVDWMQVGLNQGPPCFFIDTQREANRFCLRAERWAGHTDSDEYPNHRYVSLAALLDRVRAEGERAEARRGTFECKARTRQTDPMQDCNWPCCGCDPKANEVLAALEEDGLL